MSRMGVAWSDCHANFPLSIPGRREAASPESITPDRVMDSGPAPSAHPGNDGAIQSLRCSQHRHLPALALFHAGIQRIAGGVAIRLTLRIAIDSRKSRPERSATA